ASGLVALTFPGQPKVTAASGPMDTAASGPMDTAASGPIGTAASGPIGTAASGPIGTAASGPIGTAASSPTDTVTDEPGGVPAWFGMLRSGLAEATGVRRLVLLAALVPGFGALDEFFSLLAESTGAATAVVPLLVAVTAIGQLAGSASAGWQVRGR